MLENLTPLVVGRIDLLSLSLSDNANNPEANEYPPGLPELGCCDSMHVPL